MDKWADYLISKVLYNTEKNKIENIVAHLDNGNSVGESFEMTRANMVQHFNAGHTFATVTKNTEGKWKRLADAKIYYRDIFTDYISINANQSKDDLGSIPMNITRRKTFVSYYHKDDEAKRVEFENLTSDLIVNKSVGKNDIDSDNSDDYIKQLIQKEYLKDTTVLVVLVGNKTKCRKHVDWEISGALNYKVGNIYAGLLGLILPGHPNYGAGNSVSYDSLPARLADNFKTGYAVIAHWTENRKDIQYFIELAFERRTTHSNKIDNTRIQMKQDTCE